MRPSLADFPFFSGLGPDLLHDADEKAQWLSIPAGRSLYDAGDEADAVFAVTSGALAVFRVGNDGRSHLIGYVRPGELVGEMSFFAKHPRRSTVAALRDTEVLRIDHTLMRSLIGARPALMEDITRLILTRAEDEREYDFGASPKVIAFVSIHNEVDARSCADALKTSLNALGHSAVVVDSQGEGLRSGWFDDLEQTNDIVILAASFDEPAWARACIRQADRAWILCQCFEHAPSELFSGEVMARRTPLVFDLVAVGEDPLSTDCIASWRRVFEPARLIRWDPQHDPDNKRIARVLAGRSVGLVLSGGGARAYAHIGVVRALREAKIPIDFVGGASMGAIVAACVAMEWSDDEIEERVRDAFVKSNPLGDFVLPVISLSLGERVEKRLKHHFGDIHIENLKLPFFAVSASLTTSKLRVHRSGLLRSALRATISLPGILPPVVDGDELLVDGAVLDNFPVDEMRRMHRGIVIGVDVAEQHDIDINDFKVPPRFWNWVSRHGFQMMPPIVSVLMKSATVAVDPWKSRDLVDLLIAPEMPGIDLRDWKSFDRAVAAGYEAAVRALSSFEYAVNHMPVRPAVPEPEAAFGGPE